ncbi:MlaD family protein [Marichromatium gracile]|uniref:Phospholipid/cholesterol/gamma-HCH transport system substrate-binding protein n=1 Tax=Marichromatium gracile TaxID=1048 RepID=A0A4R4AL30_MARGR|nr:MlaD family protein [Marichromatium gracile]MBK1709575.1 mammalian cell entry protein [Marichromatium gracile]TCW40163.1 phospholipid/cholesterol/gamma-HCH transport system substrate-binding protein [Marichromatium gracile]
MSERLERLYSPPEIDAPGKRQGRAMRRDLRAAGLFVVLMAAAFVALLVVLWPGRLGEGYRLVAIFPDATGLAPGIPVIQDGYRIGRVERVEPVFASAAEPAPCGERAPLRPCFRALLRIADDWPLAADSRARIGSAGLLEGSAIKIAPGTSASRLTAGAQLPTLAPEPDLMGQLGALTASLDTLVAETITPALQSIARQIATIEALLGTGEAATGNQARLAGALDHLRALTAKLDAAVDGESIAATLEAVEALTTNLAEVSGAVAAQRDALERAVADYGALANEVRALVADNRPALRHSLDDTQALLQTMNNALLPILTNIEDASRNLSALSRALRENPASLLQGHPTEERTPWFR